MKLNTHDETLKKNYIQKYQFLIRGYEDVKSKRHPHFKKVKDFYAAHGTTPQTFLKYYARYKQSEGTLEKLLPGKRGPRYGTRRPPAFVEQLALSHRDKGCNRFEIHSLLQNELQSLTPSPSGIYNILKRHGRNKLRLPMKEEKRRIIKEKLGELGHIDCHHLSKDMIESDPRRYYVVCVVDACTRLAWAEVTTDVKALSVMFATLYCFNELRSQYDFKFAEVLTDNGPEFGPRESKKKQEHPFERLLSEMEIKHRYTRPYRPQTNGKVERFWRTLNEDLIQGTHFESLAHFKNELLKYMLYYNKLRPHSALGGKTPELFAHSCQRIT